MYALKKMYIKKQQRKQIFAKSVCVYVDFVPF